MPFIYDLNGSLTKTTILNGALIGVNTGSNGVDVSSYKGGLIVCLTSPPAIGVAPVNFTGRILSHTNNSQNFGAVVANFSIVTNGGPSTQFIGLDTRTLPNAFISAQVNVAGTNVNVYPVVTVLGQTG